MHGAHHLMAPSSGVVMTHSSAAVSSIATVCNIATLLPCLSSVIAKQPGALKELMSAKKRCRCLDEPRLSTLPPQRLYWTPSLTVCTRFAQLSAKSWQSWPNLSTQSDIRNGKVCCWRRMHLKQSQSCGRNVIRHVCKIVSHHFEAHQG